MKLRHWHRGLPPPCVARMLTGIMQMELWPHAQGRLLRSAASVIVVR